MKLYRFCLDFCRQYHPCNLYLKAHYFPKNIEGLHKIAIDIQWFNFFPCDPFSTLKMKTKLCGNPSDAAYFL